jgi:MYXO-CTERM domain-containing protein
VPVDDTVTPAREDRSFPWGVLGLLGLLGLIPRMRRNS